MIAARSVLRVIARAVVVLLLVPSAALLGGAIATPLPRSLTLGHEPSPSTRVLDREGDLLREVRADDGARARFMPLDEIGERVCRAIIAAEDRRFDDHLGVDPIAIARAAMQAVTHLRVVSGASTLTQQLARTIVPRSRTVSGKFLEMTLALRIEAYLSKREILEQYLNQVTFGPGIRGVEAASRFYFDKASKDLSLGEAAALASMPRGPSLYDPRRAGGIERLRRRRDRVLLRLEKSGGAAVDEVQRALGEPLVIVSRGASFGAPHFVQAILSGAIDPVLGAVRASAIVTTIDRGLQREIEVLTQSTVRTLEGKHVSAAAVVVIENATGEILAYVGSPDFADARRLGQNDGVVARRQPGSALKPFVYELGLERLGLTAASALPDVDQDFPVAEGDFHPQNYDGRFHGPVRLREALANSYNVPAVWTATALGPDRLLARLRDLGLGSLDASAERYGAGLALGDGEVRLVDLANAYATLARGGVSFPVRAVRSAVLATGDAVALSRASSRRVMDEGSAFVITDVLADRTARIASFGEGSVLELPFAVAVKTGTSKGYRDNITVGYTPEITVAVWVGNFDGSPMTGVSGVSGAGPLFHDAMLAASRVRLPTPFVRPSDRIEEADVCALSGARPTDACPHRRREIFASKDGVGGPPIASCAMHVRARIDRASGLAVGPACVGADVEERVFEAFPAPFAAWARAASRPLAPDVYLASCPARLAARSPQRLRVAFPLDGARFVLDPGLASRQAIEVRVEAPSGVAKVRFSIDGRVLERRAPFVLDLPLARGTHTLRADADGASESDLVEFSVD